ncbi:MAG: polyphosphate kinase 1 [Candidatus Omnitrophica bacterium]|nr:polyphosphate kinase 1 [Candidatus Omnitrophota bacterium]
MELKDKFIHRDLSWLEFNRRVLEESADGRNPLLERLKFLSIFVSNLDEFYMVRVAGVKKILEAGYNRKDQFGFTPGDIFGEIKLKADSLVKDLYDIYTGSIKTDLEKNKIFLKTSEELNEGQKKFVKRYFDTTLYPIITPMAVDQGHPFPILPSKTIALAVSIVRTDKNHLAIIPIPKSVPRLLRLPSEGEEFHFILIDYVIKDNLKEFFKGYKIQSSSEFRLLRDSEIAFDEEFAPNLLKAMEKELKKRTSAKTVYVQMGQGANEELVSTLCQGLSFAKEEIVFLPSDLDLAFFFEMASSIDSPGVKFNSYVPSKTPYENIFDKIKEEDFIIHMPYQSFFPTEDLIQTAAKDPDVLAIKMTLYRTNEDSNIIKALMEAAKRRKQVTVVVEIKARFEEEKNIQWARELEQAGCHVIYGIAGLKIHSKMTLIVRREEGRIRRYVHLSTGNYNEKTARIYTDIGYFTANDDFARDVADVFNVITGYSQPSPWKRIISSPYDLRKYFFELIDREIEEHGKHKNGSIVAKFNSLEDVQMIEKLYVASQAGVKIKLIVRGICCLVPGVEGLSENIEVRSIVGQFLEHSRIFQFNNNGSPRIFLSSADWMTRNFDRRVELLFEITKPEIKTHLQFVLDSYLKDTLKTRVLKSDQTYARLLNQKAAFATQEYFINHYTR